MRPYEACYVAGRRGVGKSETVRRVGDLAGDDTRIFVVNLEQGASAEECLEELLDRIELEGHLPLIDGIPPKRQHESDAKRFATIVKHLIMKGVIVAIDEFQNGIVSGIVRKIASMLDELYACGVPEPDGGRLIVTGSHQQRMRRLFDSESCMYQRAVQALALKPWKVDTVMRMANEHGLLARPDRLLTLWTAYGGVPRYWRRFVEDDERMLGYMTITDGDEWRERFIADEEATLGNHGERYDSGAYMEFSGLVREVLLAFADTKGKCLAFKELEKRLRDDIERLRFENPDAPPNLRNTMTMLRKDVEALSCVGEFLDNSASRVVLWRLADNDGKFQMRVFRDMFDGADDSDNPPDPTTVEDRLASLKTLEGEAFEAFTAEWLAGLPETLWAEYGTWSRDATLRQADIDVTAMIGQGENARLMLGSCKRAPESHDPDHINDLFDRLLAVARSKSGKVRRQRGWNIPEDGGTRNLSPKEKAAMLDERRRLADEWQDNPANIRRIAFSPVMTEYDRRRLADDGEIDSIGIADMATGLGLGIRIPEAYTEWLRRRIDRSRSVLAGRMDELERAGIKVSPEPDHVEIGQEDPETGSFGELDSLCRQHDRLERRITEAEAVLAEADTGSPEP